MQEELTGDVSKDTELLLMQLEHSALERGQGHRKFVVYLRDLARSLVLESEDQLRFNADEEQPYGIRGELFRELRLARELTLREVSERSGVHFVWVCRFERGFEVRPGMPVKLLNALALHPGMIASPDIRGHVGFSDAVQEGVWNSPKNGDGDASQ